MKVLVTGSEGFVGRVVCAELNAGGHSVEPFDKVFSQDILDNRALIKGSIGCDAVVRCAALLGRAGESNAAIMATNVDGTANVLHAASQANIENVVVLSSVAALGVFKGERSPDFLPLDESHPCYPCTPYAHSKYQAEEQCSRHSQATGMNIVCLRPPGVWSEQTYHRIAALRQARPEFEWDPFWEYGAFLDARDLAAACIAALKPEIEGYHCLLVSSSDITTSGKTSKELVEMLHPSIDWKGGQEYVEHPYHTLLRNDLARRTLNWEPVHRWADFVSQTGRDE